MLAVARTRTSEPLSPRAAHFARFDVVHLDSLGVTSLTIMDDPSAADSLRAWASLHGYETQVVEYGQERTPYLVVKTARFELAVQLRVGCANCGHLENV